METPITRLFASHCFSSADHTGGEGTVSGSNKHQAETSAAITMAENGALS